MNRIPLHPSLGEFVGDFAQRMCNAVHSSNNPPCTIVIGVFNGVEMTATMYSTKRTLMKSYDEKRFNSNGEWV